MFTVSCETNCHTKFRSLKKSLLLIYLILLSFAVSAQDEKPFSAELKNRYMLTDNADNLEDFSIFVTYGQVGYQRKINDWLKLGTQGNFLFHWGTDNITKRDAVTGSGPIYEGNLWNERLMTGSAEFALPALYAEMTFGNHTFTIGRFLKNTPVINAEPWPFPNALEGIWYETRLSDKLKVQLAGITKVAPRFSGEFENIGESIGVGYRWLPPLYCYKISPFYSFLDTIAKNPPIWKAYKLYQHDINLIHMAEYGQLKKYRQETKQK